ncbi:MAG: hypothetical protein ACOVLE_11325, partial [Pirellula staleyi]
PIHLHGEAPGALSAAGQLRFMTHEIVIKCPASLIPEYLVCEIGALQLGQSIHVSDLVLPAGATTITPASIVIAQVAVAAGDAAAAALASQIEPELIRKDKPAEAGA